MAVLAIDQDTLTIGDLEDFEDAVGVSFQRALTPRPVYGPDGKRVLDEKGRPVSEADVTAKALKALVWIVKRKEVPAFTLDDARQVPVSALQMSGEIDEAADSGNAIGEGD